MSFKESVKLNNGNDFLLFGLGTWLSKPGEVKNAMIKAAEIGYRAFDLAEIYKNQSECGEAIEEIIKRGIAKREELHLTGKLWNTFHKPELVEKGVDQSLEELKIDYIDTFLIHWPVSFDSPDPFKDLTPEDGNTGTAPLDLKTTLVDTWKALIAVQKKGKVKNIGVSNFTCSHIEGIIKATGVVPQINQIELHPLLRQEDLLEYCKIKGIHVTAYSPLGNSAQYGSGQDTNPLKSKHVLEVAKKHNADPAQVLLAWGRYRGYSVIPKSVTPERIKLNFEQIKIDEEDFHTINKFGQEHSGYHRHNIPLFYKPKWNINVFFESSEVPARYAVNIGV